MEPKEKEFQVERKQRRRIKENEKKKGKRKEYKGRIKYCKESYLGDENVWTWKEMYNGANEGGLY